MIPLYLGDIGNIKSEEKENFSDEANTAATINFVMNPQDFIPTEATKTKESNDSCGDGEINPIVNSPLEIQDLLSGSVLDEVPILTHPPELNILNLLSTAVNESGEIGQEDISSHSSSASTSDAASQHQLSSIQHQDQENSQHHPGSKNHQTNVRNSK